MIDMYNIDLLENDLRLTIELDCDSGVIFIANLNKYEGQVSRVDIPIEEFRGFVADILLAQSKLYDIGVFKKSTYKKGAK